MTYTLQFIGKIGLWELQIVGRPFRRRYYIGRDAAMKTVARYRRMLQSEIDRQGTPKLTIHRGDAAIHVRPFLTGPSLTRLERPNVTFTPSPTFDQDLISLVTGVLEESFERAAASSKVTKGKVERKSRRNERGQAIAEFAVILPLFIFIGLGLIDMQWSLSRATSLEYVAVETARCAAIEGIPCHSPDTPQTYALKLASQVTMRPPNFSADSVTCDLAACVAQMSYVYKPVGVWFPGITLRRTGTASIPGPPAGGGQ